MISEIWHSVKTIQTEEHHRNTIMQTAIETAGHITNYSQPRDKHRTAQSSVSYILQFTCTLLSWHL